MKNLNKFTKAELINKYTKLENLNHQNSNQTQSKYQWIFNIIDKILLFKSLILKITLISLIIRWINKYSLVKKFWHIFSLLANTLLGFTLIDIYALDVISWIKDTSIYRWYSELFSTPDIITNKEAKEDIPSRMSEINQNSNENQTNSQRNSRIIEWINRDSEKTNVNDEEVLNQEEFKSIEETNNYKYYFMIGSIVIISGVAVWCYYNDIKPGDASNAVLEKIRSFRSWLNNDSNNIINNNTGNNSMNIPTNINTPVEDIQLTDNVITQPSNNNQSSVLTSPSLENLNEQAESSWSESSSPDSDKTVTPASISESNASSSSSSSSLLNASNFIKNNWRSKLSKECNDKINFIESTLNSDIDLEEGLKLSDYYAFIINEYNKEIELYNYIKTEPVNNLEMLNGLKESMFYSVRYTGIIIY